MAYFPDVPQQEEAHQPLFEEGESYTVYNDEPEDYVSFDDESKLARHERWKLRMEVASGLSDFFGVIAGTVVILLLIALLVSIVNWLRADLNNMLTIFLHSF